MELWRYDSRWDGPMITTLAGLGAGLAILAGESFALFLMVLGAIDLYGHIQQKKERESE